MRIRAMLSALLVTALLPLAGCASYTLQGELDRIQPGTPVRVFTDSTGVIQGRFEGSWGRTIALAERPGETIEIAGFDSLWVHRDPLGTMTGIAAGLVLGQVADMVLTNMRTGDMRSSNMWRARAIGAAAGLVAATHFNDGWHRAWPGGRGQREPRGPLIVRPIASPTSLRIAVAAIPIGARMRVYRTSGFVSEGNYSGIWADSLRLAGVAAGIASDEVENIWWRPESSSSVAGAVGLGFVGLLGGFLAGAVLLGDYPQESAVVGFAFGGMTIGAVLGSAIGRGGDRWNRWR